MTDDAVGERGRGALGVDQYLARSFRAMAGLVAAALLVALGTSIVVLGIYQPQLDHLADGRAAERLSNQGMLDQETGVRGWLLTGEGRFLEPYESGKDEVRRGDGAIDDDLDHDADVASLILPVRVAEQSWMQTWAVPLSSHPPEGATNVAVLDAGKKMFDAYRSRDAALLDGIDGQISTLRSARDVTLRTSAVVQTGIFVIVVVLTLRQHRRLRAILVPPVNALLGAIRRARDGDLQVRATVAGPAEVRQLAAGFNEMTLALAEERSVRASRETEVMYQATKLRELLDMARNLAGSLNLRYVLDATAAHARSVSGFERACIWLTDEERDRLQVAHCTSVEDAPAPELEPVAMGAGAVGRAAKFGQMMTATEDGDSPAGVASLVAVPMIVGGRVVGVIELSSRRAYELPQGAATVVETLASQAGTAIEAARLHERTEELSQVDALTRLFNRRRLTADLEAEWKSSRRYGRPLSFCMFDVDHFKQYNDRRGHRSGDAVLEEVARLVAGAIRSSDSAYRYGGEEFALLLRDTPLDAAAALCERLRARVALRWRLRTDGFTITASFGVAQVEESMQGAQELVEAADRALYEAKGAGRNRVATARRQERREGSG